MSRSHIRPLQIIVANPKTAGVARWIFLALWGSKMKAGDAAAIDYVTKVGVCCAVCAAGRVRVSLSCVSEHAWRHFGVRDTQQQHGGDMCTVPVGMHTPGTHTSVLGTPLPYATGV